MADFFTKSQVYENATLSCGVPNCVDFIAIGIDRFLGHAVEEVVGLVRWEYSGPYWKGWDEGFWEDDQIC